jgi:hypothetical protein
MSQFLKSFTVPRKDCLQTGPWLSSWELKPESLKYFARSMLSYKPEALGHVVAICHLR